MCTCRVPVQSVDLTPHAKASPQLQPRKLPLELLRFLRYVVVHFVFFCEFRVPGETISKKKKRKLRGSVRGAFFETVTSNMYDSIHLQREADRHGIVAENYLCPSVGSVGALLFGEKIPVICVPRKHRAPHTFFAQEHVNACDSLLACYSLSVKMTCNHNAVVHGAHLQQQPSSAPHRAHPRACSPSRT